MDDNGYSSGVYEVSSPGFGQRLARKVRTLGHWLTVVPFIGGFFASALVGAATLLESIGSVAEGEYSKAAKQLVSGAVDTGITALMTAGDGFFGRFALWLPNVLWTAASGNTLGEQARQVTNWALDSIDTVARKVPKETEYARSMQVLGPNPMTRGYAMGAVGWSPGAAQAMQAGTNFVSYDGNQQMPANYFTNREAERRGVAPDVARANWMRDADNQRHFQDLVKASREQQELGVQAGRA